MRTSLVRLGTNYIDLYLIHWPNEKCSSGNYGSYGIFAAKGLVRNVGVSNFSVALMQQAQTFLPNHKLFLIIEYNLSQRSAEDIIPYCVKNRINIMAYRPLAKGTLLNNEIINNLAKNIIKHCTNCSIDH